MVKTVSGHTNLTVSNELKVNKINANGSVGSSGQILTSNGTATYWSSPGASGVNADAQYTWTNNHTFQADITFNANLDANVITVDTLQILGGNGTQGTITWNTDEETIDIIQNGATLQVGQEIHYHVKNQTGNTIPDGTAVMATGTLGNSGRITIAPMIANGSVLSKYYIGVTTEDIPDGEDGKVTHFGKIRGLDLSVYSEGDILWLDPTTPGGFTNTQPSAPNLKVPTAIVVSNSASVGEMFVRVQTGMNLGELHDLGITSVTNNQFIVYDNVDGRWENKTANTTIIVEGDNLYYTVARANSAIDARVTKAFVDALGVNAQTVGGNTAATLRAYSDTKAATAYSNATSYADTAASTAYSNAVSVAAADATSKAATAYSNAVSDAAADATSKAATAYTNATSYADTAASTAYSNAVSVAAADATSKAATAYTNATSYADTKAATAYSNAVSVAAADATSKASTAYSNAVSTAAADATSKAATAYSNAVTYADTAASTAYSNAVSVAASDATSKAATAYTNSVSYFNSNVNTAIDARVTKTFVDNLNVDADTLDGQDSTYYLNYNNLSNKPTIGDATINFTGDSVIIPTGSFSVNDTANTTVTLAVNTAAISITESQISDLQSYLTSETLTTLQLNTNILTYTDENGANTNIDLSLYLDDTNLARIVSGNVSSNGVATFTRDDATTFQVDFSQFFDNTDTTYDLATAANGSFGVVRLTGSDATQDNVLFSGSGSVTVTSNSSQVIISGSTDADTLDGQHGSYYLDYNNFTNTPTLYTTADANNDIDARVTKSFVDALGVDAATVGGNTAATLRAYSNTTAATAYSNATSYADTVAGTAYSNAVNYADTAASTAYSNAVSVAAADATSKASTAYSNAVSTAAADATSKAATAYSNAINYADTAASTAYSNATSYADTAAGTAYSNAVSYAGTIAGTAYSNAVSTAATDATNKAANAYSNAVSYVDSKAATAYSNATSYADTAAGTAYSNAVSYAGTIAATAYSNAVSTAAADATSKAATAYSNATSYADTAAGTAYSNAVSYVGAQSYVNTAQLSGNLSNYALLSGATFTGNVAFGDNVQAIFGTDSDLLIWNNGTHSFIEDQGGGSLFIDATTLYLRSATNQIFAQGSVDGTFALFKSGNEKLSTADNGIDIIGEANVSSNVIIGGGISANGGFGTAGQVLTSNGTVVYWADAAAGGAGGGYYFGDNGTVGDANNAANIFRVNNNTLNANVTFANGQNGSAAGPLTVANGVTLTIQSGARVAIV